MAFLLSISVLAGRGRPALHRRRAAVAGRMAGLVKKCIGDGRRATWI
jgi:hypothetical protein